MTGEYTRTEVARLDERLQALANQLGDVARHIRDLAQQSRERERLEHEASLARAKEEGRLATLVEGMAKKLHSVANSVQKLDDRVDRVEQAPTAPHPVVPANSGPLTELKGQEVRARTGLWMALSAAVSGALAWLVGR